MRRIHDCGAHRYLSKSNEVYYRKLKQITCSERIGHAVALWEARDAWRTRTRLLFWSAVARFAREIADVRRTIGQSKIPESQLTTWHDILHNVVKRAMLGEFEYFVLSAAARLGNDAYGAALRKDIEVMTGRRSSIGALYTTLDRLERKGLIVTWLGAPSPERGGRAKRMVRLTQDGICEAHKFYRAVLQVSRGVHWASERS